RGWAACGMGITWGGVGPVGNKVTPEKVLDGLPALHHLCRRAANKHGRRAGQAVEVRGGRFLVSARLKERDDLARLHLWDRDGGRDHVKVARDPGDVGEKGWLCVGADGADHGKQRVL